MFTNKQKIVYDLILQGKSTKEISILLDRPIKTIKSMITAVYKRAGVLNRKELLVKHYMTKNRKLLHMLEESDKKYLELQVKYDNLVDMYLKLDTLVSVKDLTNLPLGEKNGKF